MVLAGPPDRIAISDASRRFPAKPVSSVSKRADTWIPHLFRLIVPVWGILGIGMLMCFGDQQGPKTAALCTEGHQTTIPPGSWPATINRISAATGSIVAFTFATWGPQPITGDAA